MPLDSLTVFFLHGGYPGARSAVIERTVGKILDFHADKSRAEITKELGLTVRQFNELVASEDFQHKYNELFVELRSDPNINATRKKVVEDLLPKALKQLEIELTSRDVPWTVRQNARRDVFKMVGIEAIKPVESDRQDAAKFLASHQISINVGTANVNAVPVPNEYLEAMKSIQPEVVEGEVKELDETA